MTATQTRISYDKPDVNGLRRSRKVFVLDKDTTLQVVLDVNAKVFTIVNLNDSSVVSHGGNTKNVMVLMRKAKSALIDLGVTLTTELRSPKTFTITASNVNSTLNTDGITDVTTV